MKTYRTYFDKKTEEMKNYWHERSDKLLKKCKKLEEESDKLNEEAEKHLSNGNELEWEECLKESIEKESYALGIKDTLRELGFIE